MRSCVRAVTGGATLLHSACSHIVSLPAARRFFIYMVVLVIMHQLGVAMFRAFGAGCRSETAANTFGSFFFLSIMVLGGFVLAKPDIKVWWKWVRALVPPPSPRVSPLVSGAP